MNAVDNGKFLKLFLERMGKKKNEYQVMTEERSESLDQTTASLWN